MKLFNMKKTLNPLQIHIQLSTPYFCSIQSMLINKFKLENKLSSFLNQNVSRQNRFIISPSCEFVIANLTYQILTRRLFSRRPIVCLLVDRGTEAGGTELTSLNRPGARGGGGFPHAVREGVPCDLQLTNWYDG